MKILHVLTAPRAEGTPRLVLDWLSVHEYEQEVVFLKSDGELKSEFQATGVWQYYNTDFVLKLSNAGKIIGLLKKICDERKPDIVISWSMGFSQWVHWGARKAGVRKLIAHAGNPPSAVFLQRYVFTYLSFWIGFALGNKIIACSNYIVKEFDRIPFLPRRQYSAVYNCIRLSKFSDRGEVRNSSQAIMVATLEAHKDHSTLLKAWKIIEERGYSYQLKLAGDGSKRKELEQERIDRGIENVTFLGSRSDIPELLQQSALFVFSTTRQEGLGTVLIEAMASGCEIIASDVPACSELLQGGKYGTLVEAGNAALLADAIIIAFGRPFIYAKEGYDYAQQFSPQNMIKQYLNQV